MDGITSRPSSVFITLVQLLLLLVPSCWLSCSWLFPYYILAGDLPYAMRVLCDGLVEAVGRLQVSGPVGNSFTAHPKLDPVTGETVSHLGQSQVGQSHTGGTVSGGSAGGGGWVISFQL
jgi:hypothetical protein